MPSSGPQPAAVAFSSFALLILIALSACSKEQELPQPDPLEAARAQYDETVRLNPEYAASELRRGCDLSTPSSLQRAIQELDRAILSDPGDATAYFQRGLVYAKLKQYDRAVEDLTHALGLDPEYAAAFYHRSQANTDLGDMELAVEDYRRFRTLNPNYTETLSPWAAVQGQAAGREESGAADALRYVRWGEVQMAQGSHSLARAQFGEAIRIYGEVSRQMRAEGDFDALERLGPEHALAYFNRALAYAEQAEHFTAIRDMNLAVLLDSSRAEFYLTRGKASEELGDLWRARADYDAAIRLDPDNGEAYYRRAGVHADLGDVRKAVSDYDQIIAAGAAGPAAFANRADALVALAYGWEQTPSIRLDDGGPSPIVVLLPEVRPLRARGPFRTTANLNRAIQEVSRDRRRVFVASFEPRRPPSALETLRSSKGLHSSKFDLDTLERAVGDYGGAIRMGMGDWETYFKRGLALLNLGIFDKAVADFSAAISLDPRSADVYVKRGMAYTVLGRGEEAARDFDRAIAIGAD